MSYTAVKNAGECHKVWGLEKFEKSLKTRLGIVLSICFGPSTTLHIAFFSVIKCNKNCRKLSYFSNLFEYTKFYTNFNIVSRFLLRRNFRQNLTFDQDFIQSVSSHKTQCKNLNS
jgi:hypothetical protein